MLKLHVAKNNKNISKKHKNKYQNNDCFGLIQFEYLKDVNFYFFFNLIKRKIINFEI